jgi:tetratricopeptide (TPR) repeat protein
LRFPQNQQRINLTATVSLLFFTSMFFTAQSDVFAEDSSARTQTLEIDDSGPLKKAGADKLNIYVEEGANGAAPMKVWLQGTKHDKVVWKKPVPIQDEFNSAKMDAVCRNGKLLIMSQFSGSAAYVSETFGWDGNAVRFLSKKQGDPSMAEVVRLTNLAKSGSRAQMEQWENEDHNVQYPGSYITVESTDQLLSAGQNAAIALSKAGKPALAARRIEICFDASAHLIGLACGGDSDKTATPDKWIDMWQEESIQLPAKDWAPRLACYARFLQESGNHKLAINVLRAVVKAQPDQQEPYLSLADSLWAVNQHREAAQMYQKYQQLVGQDASKTLPPRVKSRASS